MEFTDRYFGCRKAVMSTIQKAQSAVLPPAQINYRKALYPLIRQQSFWLFGKMTENGDPNVCLWKPKVYKINPFCCKFLKPAYSLGSIGFVIYEEGPV